MNRHYRLFYLFLTLLLALPTATSTHAPQYAEPSDEAIFIKKVEVARMSGSIKTDALAVARDFLGTPYVAGTLDANGENEQLVVNMRQLDCWTLVECAVAVALTARKPNGDFDDFKNQLRNLRYWGGTIDGYGSRIHYFTGWMLQAEKLGLMTDLTAQLGGSVYNKEISFMTDMPKLYPMIKNPAERKKVHSAQDRINAHTWHYIPKAHIIEVERFIEEGDIVILTSSRHNLDVEHQGFAVRLDDGRVHLLHASSTAGRVIISARPLSEYVTRIKSMSGIMVARLSE